MAKSRIQGITIELDGNTTGLNNALKDVTKRSVDLQSELRDVERLLKFDPGNVEALAQKQQLLTQQIENTTEKLNRLKAAQEQVEQQFQSGDIGEKQYRAFRREIEYTEKTLKDLDSKLSALDGSNVAGLKNDFNQVEQSAENATGEVANLGNELLNLAAGAGAVKGLGEVIESALDISSTNTTIDIAFNLSEESEESVKNAINQVKTYGVDAEEALEGVRRQWALNGEASDEANEKVVKYASTLTAAYSGVDFTEIIQESSELSKILGINNDEAVALFDTLIELGFPPDQLDIIAEYGQQLQMMGYNAEEVMGLFASGVATGTNNIDQLIDGVKEGRIVMAEFGATIDEETSLLLSNVGISTEQFQAWGKAIAAGGDGGKQAMEQVAAAIADIDDKTLQNQVGVKVFGTLWEEQQTNITSAILGVNDHMLDMGGMIDTINEKTGQMDQDPTVRMRKAMTDFMVALTPVLEIVAKVVGAIADWVSENSTLAAIIAGVGTALGIIVGIFAALAPILTAVSSLAGVLGISLGAIAAPVGIVVAAIAAVIAIGVALWKNWDVIKAKAIEIWNLLSNFLLTTWENIKNALSVAWEGIKNYLSNTWEFIKQTATNVWESIGNFFTQKIPEIINSLINWFNELPYKLGYIFGQVLGNIIQWGIDTFNYFTTNIPIWIQNVGNWFSELPGKIGAALSNAFNNIYNWGVNVYNNMIQAASNAINSVGNWFSELPGRISSWLYNAISNVVNFASNLAATGREAGANFVNSIINTVSNLPSKLYQVGANIVQGVWNGISGMWGWFTDKVTGFFNGIVDGVKNVLGIHSPSRVFAEIGTYTGEGFIQGIDGMKKAVNQAGQEMANAAIPTINAPDLGQVTAGEQVVYLTNETYLDGKLIGSETTKQVINNMGRSSRNYKMGKGGLGYA